MTPETEQLCRLEMLMGHLMDQLMPARELVAALRLQSNAAATTRGKLEHLIDLTGSLWEVLTQIRDEAQSMKDGATWSKWPDVGGGKSPFVVADGGDSTA